MNSIESLSVLNIFRFTIIFFLSLVDDVLIICKSIIPDNSRIFISLNSIQDLLWAVQSLYTAFCLQDQSGIVVWMIMQEKEIMTWIKIKASQIKTSKYLHVAFIKQAKDFNRHFILIQVSRGDACIIIWFLIIKNGLMRNTARTWVPISNYRCRGKLTSRDEMWALRLDMIWQSQE